MAINLSRNTKVYFTTNVDSTGAITDSLSGFTNTNTWEIAVLDGYSFSQGTQQQTITISEGGNIPVRGQRSFNTQLDPVDYTFSTYIRPNGVGSLVAPQEKVLFNALLGTYGIDAGVTPTSIIRSTTATSVATIVSPSTLVNGTYTLGVGDTFSIAGITAANQSTFNNAVKITAIPSGSTYTVEYARAPAAAAGTTATVGTSKAYTGQWAPGPVGTASGQFSYVSTMGSNRNSFQKFGLLFVVDSVVYAIDNCFLDQASIDFGLDAIATVAWTGKGTKLKELTTNGPALATALLSATTATPNIANAPYITNKLSTMSLQSNIGGSDFTSATTYTIAITGGNLTIANNVTYQVPSNLGVINQAIGYFPGNRAVSGNVTAYLRTGASEGNNTGKLLSDIIAANSVEPKFRVQLELGGGSNAVRVEFEMPGASLQVPQVNIADVVATTINFNAQGFTPDTQGSQAFDLTKANDLQIRYFTNISAT